MYQFRVNSLGYELILYYGDKIYHRFQVSTKFEGLQLIKSLGMHVKESDRLIA